MALAKLATLVSTFPGPGLPPEWISTGSPASVTGGVVSVPPATDFSTSIVTTAFYDPTNSSIYGRLSLSTPRSYTTTPAAPAFVPYNRIGAQQPGGAQCKVLNGLNPGFTVGQQATGQMKPTIDHYEALTGDHIEAVGIGLPNGFGSASSLMNALSGETRFIVFACPMVPLNQATQGSITTLLAGGYDTAIIAMINSMVTAGFGGLNVSMRIGWEANSGTSSLNSYPWSTGFIDPLTGLKNGPAQYKAGAQYFETLIRAHGYTGYIEWCVGNADSSASPLATVMPTHATGANKLLTLVGYDMYFTQGGSLSKNDFAGGWAAKNTYMDTLLAYATANGYLLAHGEYGQTYVSSSTSYFNDNDQFFAYWYAKLAANASKIAYAIHYQQNQPYTPGTILQESHQIAFCGGQQGVPSTVVGTGTGAAGAISAATMGSLHNVADSGTWTLTNDPNKALAKTSWLANFGGTGGKGAAHLGIPYVVPQAPVTNGPRTQVILTPGGSHNPAVSLLMEFDYNKTQNSITVNFLDDGTVVNTAAAANNIWFQIADNGTNVIWSTSPDGITYTTARTAARPAWWNSTDGVQVSITNHNDDGTQTDPAFFDKFNVTNATPNPITNLAVHVSGTSAALTWSPPALGTVQGYIITATPLNTSSPTLSNQTVTTPAAVFLNLTPGSSYLFTVTDYNSAGPGLGVTSAAINISGTGTGAGGTPTTPTGSITTGVPNSLPVTPLPTAYYPITLTTQSDDGDSLATAALQRFADLSGNGWRPYLGNPEVVALQVASYVAADLRSLVRSVGTSMFAAFGQQVLQNPQYQDSASQIVTTWTSSDANGHTVPAGTQVSYPAAGSQPLTFTTRGDLSIPAGQTQVTGIVMLSDQVGSYTNQVPIGPLELQANISWLTGVTVTTAATGGQDAETDADYLNRLIEFCRTLSQALILPADYAIYAQQASSAVYRAYAVPNYDATHPGVSNVERTVSVFLLGPDGLPVQSTVAIDVGTQMNNLREANFNVITVDASNNTITPIYVSVAINATVVCRTGYAQPDVQNAVMSAVSDYLNPAYWEGGLITPPTWTGRVLLRQNDLAAVIAAVPGVDHIDSLNISGGAVPVTGTNNYQLAPSSFTRAVLPAGTYSSPSHWSSPTTITITANPPAFS
jgi:hypothetical protein